MSPPQPHSPRPPVWKQLWIWLTGLVIAVPTVIEVFTETNPYVR